MRKLKKEASGRQECYVHSIIRTKIRKRGEQIRSDTTGAFVRRSRKFPLDGEGSPKLKKELVLLKRRMGESQIGRKERGSSLS